MAGYGCGACMSWSPGGPGPGVGPEIASPGVVEHPRIFTSSVLREPEKVQRQQQHFDRIPRC
eukprot:8629116-Pyramimonas_sp.AAC.1